MSKHKNSQSSMSDELTNAAKTWLSQQQWLQSLDTKQLADQAQQLGAKVCNQYNRLSTKQKLVGGALLVSGLSWLALRAKGHRFGICSRPDDAWQRSSESVYRGATNPQEGR